MIFHKTSTSGNDFIIVDRVEFNKLGKDRGVFAEEICDRNKTDGVIFFSPGEEVYNFSIFNSDGSEAEISGNGMAGLAATLFSTGEKTELIKLKTRAGIRTIRLLAKEGSSYRQEIDMGLPEFNEKKFFPFLTPGKKEYEHNGTHFFPVSTGNPHAVIFLEKEPAEIEELEITGRELESGDIFPERTNVEFIFPIDKADSEDIPVIETFFYERGAGVTPFSSTGSTAVFSVLHDLGIAGNSIKIKTPEEPVLISLKERIYIESYTKIVYKGEYHG